MNPAMLLMAIPALVAAEATIQSIQSTPAMPSMPQWWEHWKRADSFKTTFIQKGESAAFGSLTKTGAIVTAKGGRLRVEYEKGVLLLSNGRLLIQYDPSTRTAQRFDLENVTEEWPLLRLLTDPSALSQVFNVTPHSDGKIKLTPKKQGGTELPEILLEGKGAFLFQAEWKDGTGAKQTLTLTNPKNQPDPGNKPFEFNAPKGVKWIQ